MKKRLILLAATLALAATGIAPALASGPGPNGHNNGGLCNAAGRGSATGQANKQANSPAFQALAQYEGMEGPETSSDTETAQDACGSMFGQAPGQG